jgi:hypothetical protein
MLTYKNKQVKYYLKLSRNLDAKTLNNLDFSINL